MSDARHSFAQRLQAEFKDQAIQKQCQQSSLSALENKMPTRAFDLFPCLLDKPVFDVRCDKFKFIISATKSVDQDNEFKLTNEDEKNAIKGYTKAIIKTACQELLDEKGHIKE